MVFYNLWKHVKRGPLLLYTATLILGEGLERRWSGTCPYGIVHIIKGYTIPGLQLKYTRYVFFCSTTCALACPF